MEVKAGRGSVEEWIDVKTEMGRYDENVKCLPWWRTEGDVRGRDGGDRTETEKEDADRWFEGQRHAFATLWGIDWASPL